MVVAKKRDEEELGSAGSRQSRSSCPKMEASVVHQLEGINSG